MQKQFSFSLNPLFLTIQGAMMSIAFKEGLKIPPPALNEVILASNQDIRQVLQQFINHVYFVDLSKTRK